MIQDKNPKKMSLCDMMWYEEDTTIRRWRDALEHTGREGDTRSKTSRSQRVELWCVDSALVSNHLWKPHAGWKSAHPSCVFFGIRIGLQIHHDHFPQSTAHSITGAIPERGILSASDLISMIHKPLKNSALLNIQKGAWQGEGREISRQKELGRRNKSYWNL